MDTLSKDLIIDRAQILTNFDFNDKPSYSNLRVKYQLKGTFLT